MKENKVIKIALSGGLVLAGLANVVSPVENISYAVKSKDGVCEVETKDGELKFTTSATTSVVEKPLDLLLVLDQSGSMGQSSGKAIELINYAKFLVKSLSEDSQVMMAWYDGNLTDSYASGSTTRATGGISRMLTKAEALKVLQDAMLAGVDFTHVADTVRALGYIQDLKGYIPFEDTFEAVARPKATHSVLQITDTWDTDEDIDESFATWAKTNAKTFMSVIVGDSSGGNSIDRMKAVGHPNIYTTARKKYDQIERELVEQFKSTAVEKSVPTVNINVLAPQGVNLKTVKLVNADGVVEDLAITNNGVNIDREALVDGEWTLKIQAEGLVKEQSEVIAKVTSNGSELASTKIVFEPCVDDVKGTDEERTTENIDFNTIYEDDETLKQGEEKVKTEGVVGVREILKVWNTVNGQRVGEPTVTSKMVTDVVNKVILRGTQVKKDFTYRILDANDKEKVLVDTTKVSDGYKGDAYKLESLPTLEGYEVVVPEGVSLEGVFNGEAINVDLVAYKLGDYAKLSYLDEQGNPIKDATELIAKGQRLGAGFTGEVEKELKVGDKLYRLDTVVVKSLENKGFDKVEGLEDKGTYLELKGNVVDDTLQYVAHYKEVKAAPVKVKFVDENGKELQKEINLLKDDSKLDGDYSFTPEKRIKVGNDEYAFVGIDFEDKETKEIKGKFGEKEFSYTVKYKKVVKLAPQKLPKTSVDNNFTDPYAALSSLLGLLGLGFLFRKTK